MGPVLVDFFYNNSSWIVGPTVVLTFVVVGLSGLVLAHRAIPHKRRQDHNEFVGFTVAVVSAFYAVLLAFIAIAVWESFGKAGTTAAHEASLAGDIARDASTMPDPIRGRLVSDIDAYLEQVLNVEWKAMAEGHSLNEAGEGHHALSDKGWEILFDAHSTLVTFRSTDRVEATMFGELLSRLNALYDARRERLLASEERLQPVVWGIVLTGALITIGMTFLFGMESFAMHAILTAFVAATMGLVVMLIVAFDYPFRGAVQIPPDAFLHVQSMMQRLEAKP